MASGSRRSEPGAWWFPTTPAAHGWPDTGSPPSWPDVVPPTLLADVIAVLAELVGNAVRHAEPLPGGVIRVAWRLRPGRRRS